MFWILVLLGLIVVAIIISAIWGDKIFNLFSKGAKKFTDDTVDEEELVELKKKNVENKIKGNNMEK